MTKRFVSIFLFALSLSPIAHAQYINLQLKIEPELSATIEQDLNFGTQVTNSGRTEIQLGDVNMGVFSIKAFHTQNVYLNLHYPNALSNDNPAIDSDIPLELNLAYNNTGTNNANNSNPVPSNGGFISIHEYTALESRNDVWKQMYLYVYGAIEIGNIPNGVYTGDIVLSVDYD
ncbi:MAG: hypothetical protein CL670_08890 [Balneola sp.]|nr:hypothetical protein [Balneola sp.]MBE79255.1 hypothetical protein [Balneola sp.]|tara:strand:- start:223 stop:744 length:522 start_codon:yes stop_codon:yes gene_type:complete